MTSSNNCNNCGTQLLPYAKFCPSCGLGVDRLIKCATCGKDNQVAASFCQLCGTSLSEDTASGILYRERLDTSDGSTPQGMVSFTDAVKFGFKGYFQFGGRATRAEYWWWCLFWVIVFFTASLIDGVFSGSGIFTLLFVVGTVIPYWALLIRRLHDTNKTGWWVLTMFIPLVGPIIHLLLCCHPSHKGPNKYGADPRHVGAKVS